MMNEASNAGVPQEKPAILAVSEENAKMIEIANTRVEDILRKLRGDRPVPQTEASCRIEPTFGALRNLTESSQRQLNRLLRNIDDLDNLI